MYCSVFTGTDLFLDRFWTIYASIIFFLIPSNQQCSCVNFFVRSFWYRQYNQHEFYGKCLLFSIFWRQIINMYILFRSYGKRPLSTPVRNDLCSHYRVSCSGMSPKGFRHIGNIEWMFSHPFQVFECCLLSFLIL